MNILFVTPQWPEPPKKGTTLRNRYLIAGAAERHQVEVVAMLGPGDPPTFRPGDVAPLGVPIHGAPAPRRTIADRLRTLFTTPTPDLAARLRSAAAHDLFVATLRRFRPDVVQFEAVEAAGAVGPIGAACRAAGVRPAVIYDAHNAEHLLQRTIAQTDLRRPTRWLGAAYSMVQARRLARYEAWLSRVATAVIAVSDGDAAALERISGVRPTVVPNGVDTDFYAPGPTASPAGVPDGPVLLFVGALDFRPNIDAARWFATAILPLIRAELPTATFVVVGRDPAPAVRALAGPGVVVIGPVPDERPWLRHAAVCVAPLRMGGGMRFKIVQAFAAGAPVVSTTLGAEGVAAEDGVTIRLADTPRAFADAVIATIRQPDRVAAQVAAARALAVERYDWRAILPALHSVYDRLAPVAVAR